MTTSDGAHTSVCLYKNLTAKDKDKCKCRHYIQMDLNHNVGAFSVVYLRLPLWGCHFYESLMTSRKNGSVGPPLDPSLL